MSQQQQPQPQKKRKKKRQKKPRNRTGAAQDVAPVSAVAIDAAFIQTWNDVGAVAHALWEQDRARRGLPLEPIQCVETHADPRRREITIRLRRLLPQEDTASLIKAQRDMGGFNVSPQLARELADRENQNALERLKKLG